MKTAASITTCWAAMLGLLALLLVSAPATAQSIHSIPGGISPAPAPVTATLAPTATGEVGTVNPPPAATEEDDEEPVVIDILVAGDGRNQTGAITALLKVLAARSDITSDHSKVNSTVEWEPKKHGHHDDHDRRLRRALRTVPMAKKAAKDADEDELDLGSNSTNCQMILNGGNYSVVHITLHGSSEKVCARGPLLGCWNE
jgi:hypothetical protein